MVGAGFSAIWLVAASACGLASKPSTLDDCGSFAAGHNTYDAAGLECFWKGYTAGTPVRWAVSQLTDEGDPIPSTITFDPPSGIVVTRNVTADHWSAAADRRVWTWRCTTVAKKPWATDATRYFFELGSCSGDGKETAFP